MIEVKNLTKRYGSNTAVSNLSFTAEKGMIYGFLGPNGAGKSTTMNMMTGYIAPSSGQVLIDGHDIVEDGQAARKCIGYLPEIPPVYPEMTVKEYLVYAASLKKVPEKKQKEEIARVMDQTGLLEMQDRLIRNLSKGYRQRTGLAQAMIGDPDILILDEPMVGLDPRQIIEIRELIRSFRDKHTVILSSHILSEISEVCDHIMIISHGKLVASDSTPHLIEKMNASQGLEVTAMGTEEQVRRILDSTGQIEDYLISASAEDGGTDIEIRTENHVDIRVRLFLAFADAGIPLVRIAQKQTTLEEIFLELTDEDTKDSDADPGGSGKKEVSSPDAGKAGTESAPDTDINKKRKTLFLPGLKGGRK